MILKIATLFVSLILLAGFRSVESEKLKWAENYKLHWSDFQAVPDQNNFGSALTAVSISAKPFLKNKKLHYSVSAYFLKEKSWFKNTSINLINHEQLHFDIAELYARKIRKLIASYGQAGVENYRIYNEGIKNLMDESNYIDQQYDRETLNGSLTQRQICWELEIRKLMNELNAYR